MIHELNTLPQYYERIEDGSMTFTIRRNDPGFSTGDTIILHEYDYKRGSHDRCEDDGCTRDRYTGRSRKWEAGYIAAGDIFGVELGRYVIISLLEPLEHEAQRQITA